MSIGTKSFVFNRNSTWRLSNYSSNTKVCDNTLRFMPDFGTGSVFFSHSLDSIENNMSWGTFKVISKVSQNSKIVFKFFASDSKDVVVPIEGQFKKLNMDKFLRSDTNFNIKIEVFDKLGALKFENPKYAPLFGLKGRYLWFCIESTGVVDEPTVVKELEITFPNLNFVEYLPEIYQKFSPDSFMYRYMYIFQSIYLDTEKIIDNIPENFEPIYANKEFLSWICRWFKVDYSIWNQDKIRFLMYRLVEIFKSKGTKASILNMVENYIGEKPIIVEKFRICENDFYEKEKTIIDNLFGKNNFFFTVIIVNSNLKSNEEYINLIKIIKDLIPIDAICNLVVLSKNISLGYHSYIGINSYISNSRIQEVQFSNSIMIVD